MTFRLTHAEDFIELTILEVADSPEATGDARLQVEVWSSGFSGKSDAWVDSESLREFCRDLLGLEQTMSGEARLASMSPSELQLVIKAVDSLGHFAVAGSVGRQVYAERGSIFHSVAFGFEFEPDQLRAASSVDWVEANSA